MARSPLLLALGAGAAMLTSSTPAQAAADDRCYEMRVYYAAEGKLDDLHARFRDHTMAFFEKHGMTNIGYWTPIENSRNELVYVLSYPSREARETSWKAFGEDPGWIKAKADSEKNGKLVEKAETTFLQATDFSPEIKPSKAGAARTFELRTYTTTEGNLDNLLKRFRAHTMELFSKHGMTNFAYWVPMKDQPKAENTLVYILAHQSKEAAEASFKSFREDPAWVKARQASEDAAGGSLTVAKDGVVSVFMTPTDYSPTR